jgi:hypothetical protein
MNIDEYINNELKYSFENNYDNIKSIKHLLQSNYNKTKMHHYCWHLLHSFSVYYPENPTENEIITTKLFLKNVHKYFSYCGLCSSLDLTKFYITYNIDEIIINKINIINFFIDLHKFINLSIKSTYQPNIYTIDFIINRYSTNNFIFFFENKYNFKLSELIFSNNHDKIKILLFDIQKKINSESLDYDFKLEILLK